MSIRPPSVPRDDLLSRLLGASGSQARALESAGNPASSESAAAASPAASSTQEASPSAQPPGLAAVPTGQFTRGSLAGCRLVITGASRGIGLAIGLRAAADGARVAVVSKTAEPHPKLPGTVYSAVAEIEHAGGEGLACIADIRDESQARAAIDRVLETWNGIDVLVNNASAIFLAGTLETPLKRFDLMHSVNVRGTFLMSQLALPSLLRSENPHILNIAPPLNLNPLWFAPHVAYTISKYGMSMCVLGMAEELRSAGVAVNALWPCTAIATAAVQNLLGGEAAYQRCRHPRIMADAAHAILTQPARLCTRNFFTDEEILRSVGVHDFESYRMSDSGELLRDFFLDAPLAPEHHSA